MMNWIDAHCHLSDPRFDGILPSELAAAEARGVTGWVLGGVSPDDWQRQRELAKTYPGKLTLSFGLHPWWVAKATDEAIGQGLRELEKALPDAAALGETGLDRLPQFTERWDAQLDCFKQQLGLAERMKKPLILHIVRAHSEALQLLETQKPKFGGIVHSFTGSWAEAQRYWALGFLISISGVVTRPGYRGTKETAEKLPSEALVIETDAPDQSPGTEKVLNRLVNLLVVAEQVGKLRKKSAAEVLTASTRNIKRLFQR